MRRSRYPVLLRGAVRDEGLCVRNAEGRPKGGSRRRRDGGALAPEPRSQPDPERSEGARPEVNLESYLGMVFRSNWYYGA